MNLTHTATLRILYTAIHEACTGYEHGAIRTITDSVYAITDSCNRTRTPEAVVAALQSLLWEIQADNAAW